MDAFHSLWTKPSDNEPEEYVLLTMLLSALMWRKKNGRITMVTDTYGARLLEKYGISHAWDDVVTALDNIPSHVNPTVFWAAGKIYALSHFEAPVVSIDTDFIVWESLNLERSKSDITVIHRETLNPSVYPDSVDFVSFDDGFDWTVLPANTAFVYFGNNSLASEYIKYADCFMSTYKGGGTLCPMVFAEQRLLAMLTKKMKLRMNSFSSLEKLMGGEDERFTHLWGYKKNLAENPDEKERLVERLHSRIKKEFPEFEWK